MRYSYQCKNCKRVEVIGVVVEQRDHSHTCPACAGDMHRSPALDYSDAQFVIPAAFHTSGSDVFPKGVPKHLMPAPEAKGGRLDNASNTGNLKYVPGMDFNK